MNEYGILPDDKTGIVYSVEMEEVTQNAIIKSLENFYEKNPLRNVIPGDSILDDCEITSLWGNEILYRMVKKLMLEKLGKGYSISGYEYTLNKTDQLDMGKIKRLFQSNTFDLLSVKEMQESSNLPPKRLSDMLHLLKENGDLFSIGDNLWIPNDIKQNLFDILSNYFITHQSLSVGQFKSLTNQSRKGAIPLLEYCDKIGWTKRNGNDRIKGSEIHE